MCSETEKARCHRAAYHAQRQAQLLRAWRENTAAAARSAAASAAAWRRVADL